MASKNYDSGLAAGVEVSKQQLQAGYNLDALNQPPLQPQRAPGHGTHSPDAELEKQALTPTKPTPWHKTRKGIIIIAVVLIIIIGAVVGGAVGGTRSSNKSSGQAPEGSVGQPVGPDGGQGVGLGNTTAAAATTTTTIATTAISTASQGAGLVTEPFGRPTASGAPPFSLPVTTDGQDSALQTGSPQARGFGRRS